MNGANKIGARPTALYRRGRTSRRCPGCGNAQLNLTDGSRSKIFIGNAASRRARARAARSVPRTLTTGLPAPLPWRLGDSPGVVRVP
jgi:hypothetical protein